MLGQASGASRRENATSYRRGCDALLWRPLVDFCWTPPLMSGGSLRGLPIKPAGGVLVDRMSHFAVQQFAKHPLLTGNGIRPASL